MEISKWSAAYSLAGIMHEPCRLNKHVFGRFNFDDATTKHVWDTIVSAALEVFNCIHYLDTSGACGVHENSRSCAHTQQSIVNMRVQGICIVVALRDNGTAALPGLRNSPDLSMTWVRELWRWHHARSKHYSLVWASLDCNEACIRYELTRRYCTLA